jgi:hypothetical protein
MRQNYFTDEEADFINRTLVPVRFAGPITVLFDGKTEPEQIPVVQIVVASFQRIFPAGHGA